MITIANQNFNYNPKSRNFFLSILLLLFVLADFYTLKTILDSNSENDEIDLTYKINYFYLVFTVLDLIFTIFIFRWKKWAFWGTLTVSLLTFLLNLYIQNDLVLSLIGFSGVLLLFALLQLKSKKVSGWKNLE